MKASVDILFFNRDALMQTEADKKLRGQLYLEKRPNGKFLCFKKADVLTSILLTKKMYKSLKRFCDIEYDQDDGPTEDDVYYSRNGDRIQTNLLMVINTPPKPRILSPFIIQVFQYVEKK